MKKILVRQGLGDSNHRQLGTQSRLGQSSWEITHQEEVSLMKIAQMCLSRTESAKGEAEEQRSVACLVAKHQGGSMKALQRMLPAGVRAEGRSGEMAAWAEQSGGYPGARENYPPFSVTKRPLLKLDLKKFVASHENAHRQQVFAHLFGVEEGPLAGFALAAVPTETTEGLASKMTLMKLLSNQPNRKIDGCC